MKLSFFYLISALALPLVAVTSITTSCAKKTEQIKENLFDYQKFSDEGDFTIISENGANIKQYSFSSDWTENIPDGNAFFSWLFNDYGGSLPLPEPNNKYPVNLNAKYFAKIIEEQDDFFLIPNRPNNPEPEKPKILKAKDINTKTIEINGWGQAKLTYDYSNDKPIPINSLHIQCRNTKQKMLVDFRITKPVSKPTSSRSLNKK